MAWVRHFQLCELRGGTEIDAGFSSNSPAGNLLIADDSLFVTNDDGEVLKYKIIDDPNCKLDLDWEWENNGMFFASNGIVKTIKDSQDEVAFKTVNNGLARLDGEIDDCYIKGDVDAYNSFYWYETGSFYKVPLSVSNCEEEKIKFKADGVRAVFSVEDKMINAVLFNSLSGPPSFLYSYSIEKDNLPAIYKTPLTGLKGNSDYLCGATRVLSARGYVVVLDSECGKLAFYRESGGFVRAYSLKEMFKNKDSKKEIIDIQYLNGLSFIISVREKKEIKLYRTYF